MQEIEERNMYYVQDELPVLRLEEPPNNWDVDSNDGYEAAGEARGPSGPARAADVEQEMEEFLRVATPDIPTPFPRPAWDLSCRPDVSAGDAAQHLDDFGAECLRLEQAEAEYRARREQAKVWRRERDEDLRRVLEARARQDQEWSGDLAHRVDLMMERGKEERVAEERRVMEAEREQLEEQKRNEERRQLEEKRREVEKKRKEDKKRREEEKRLEEEKRQERMRVVEEATARAKKKKKELDEQKELKARLDAEEYKLFVVKEAEREKMLADEAKERLAKKSEEANRARMAKAEKDWQELQEKESAEGVPLGSSVFSYRSRQADQSREAFESMGNLRDRWNEASLEKGHWFDSDLCILEPINSTQMAVFEQLKVTGLLCSRFSATVKKGRRFFALVGKDVELPNSKGGKKKVASQRQQAASQAASALDGGSHAEGEMDKKLLATPGPSGVDVSVKESKPPEPAVDSAAAAGPAAAGPAAAGPAVEPAGERSPALATGQMAAVEPAMVELSGPAAESAAVMSAAGPAAAVEPMSETLSGLALGSAAVENSAAGLLAGGPAAAEPVATAAVVSAAVPTPTREGRPVLADGPAAGPRECWVIKPGITPKVIVRRIPSGSAAAAEAVASWEIRAGEPVPELGSVPAAGRAVAETRTSPMATTSRLAVPAAPAPGKRKAGAGVARGSQKRKRSSPVKIKDL